MAWFTFIYYYNSTAKLDWKGIKHKLNWVGFEVRYFLLLIRCRWLKILELGLYRIIGYVWWYSLSFILYLVFAPMNLYLLWFVIRPLFLLWFLLVLIYCWIFFFFNLWINLFFALVGLFCGGRGLWAGGQPSQQTKQRSKQKSINPLITFIYCLVFLFLFN